MIPVKYHLQTGSKNNKITCINVYLVEKTGAYSSSCPLSAVVQLTDSRQMQTIHTHVKYMLGW